MLSLAVGAQVIQVRVVYGPPLVGAPADLPLAGPRGALGGRGAGGAVAPRGWEAGLTVWEQGLFCHPQRPKVKGQGGYSHCD